MTVSTNIKYRYDLYDGHVFVVSSTNLEELLAEIKAVKPSLNTSSKDFLDWLENLKTVNPIKNLKGEIVFGTETLFVSRTRIQS